MKISEAIEKLKVGDEVWVKGKVDEIDQEDIKLPLKVEFGEVRYYVWVKGGNGA